jgi:predicted ATPase
VKEGLTVFTEAFALMHRTGELRHEVELNRLKGELLLRQGEAARAEACFQRALDIARHQQARSLELRAATNLARLWPQQGKRDEARQLLAEVYGWFTEGFDTADLQEARALLEAL